MLPATFWALFLALSAHLVSVNDAAGEIRAYDIFGFRASIPITDEAVLLRRASSSIEREFFDSPGQIDSPRVPSEWEVIFDGVVWGVNEEAVAGE